MAARWGEARPESRWGPERARHLRAAFALWAAASPARLVGGPPRSALVTVAFGCALVLFACAPEPESKVKRWASEVSAHEPSESPPEDPLSAPLPEPIETAPQPAAQPKLAPAPPGPSCARVVDRACQTLGIHSDECREVRDLVPSSEPPAIRAACVRVMEEEAGLLEPGGLGEGQSPCLMMVRKICQRRGYKSAACDEAKSASRMLTNARRSQACIGEMLLFDLREALNPSGTE